MVAATASSEPPKYSYCCDDRENETWPATVEALMLYDIQLASSSPAR